MINNFDTDSYLEINPDVKNSIENSEFKDILEHLNRYGLNEIKNGSRMFHKDYHAFDESLYLETFSGVKEAVENEEFTSGFDHFCQFGYAEILAGTRPWEKVIHQNKVNDAKEINIHTEDEIIQPINIMNFNEESYLEINNDIKEAIAKGNYIDALDHMEKVGHNELESGLRKFHKDFEPYNEDMYLELYQDVKEAVLNGQAKSGFEHFCKFGYAEIIAGYREWIKVAEHDVINYIEIVEYLPKLVQEAFDEEYYLENNPDVKNADIAPFEHYFFFGWKEGRQPNDYFDSMYYFNTYPDVAESGMEPLDHYVKIGQYENRKVKEFKISKIEESLKNNIPKIIFDNTIDEYRDFKEHEQLDTHIKTIAFYLPQFHPFPENDKWWGKGFTEWTNVTKAQPNFINHYQPHLPIHNGFYDLRVPEVMIEQAKLAKNYGIHGFNFYYYWFDGKILMDKPFEILLKHKEIDIDFCITWANENWTRRWDGAENDILIGQNHSEEDSIKFIENLYPYFEDERYLRIDNKPILIIYRADIIPNMKETVDLWRRKVQEAGFDGIYLICSQTFGISSPEPYGFDAAMEFPPHTVFSEEINDKVTIVNEAYAGTIYDYEQVVKNACTKEEPEYKMFRTSMLSWDNTARKQNNSNTFYNFSLLKYKQWFSNTVNSVFNNEKYKEDEKLVFVNAWNEWAEGTHLEPDRKYGYGYLQTTYDVLKNYKSKYDELFNKKTVKKENDIAVILHIHYTDLWDDIKQYLLNLESFGFDLFVTITNTDDDIVERIIKQYPNANIKLVENRGRDILPFINTFRSIKGLDYKYICKIHSKKSEYRDDGDNIRDEIYDSLLGSKKIIQKIIDLFENTENTGLIIKEKYLIKHNNHNMTYNKEIVNDLAGLLGFPFEYSVFPAGSMFWFNPEAFNGIEKIEDNYFSIEEGLADGTVPHGIERLFCAIVKSNKYEVRGLIT